MPKNRQYVLPNFVKPASYIFCFFFWGISCRLLFSFLWLYFAWLHWCSNAFLACTYLSHSVLQAVHHMNEYFVKGYNIFGEFSFFFGAAILARREGNFCYFYEFLKQNSRCALEISNEYSKKLVESYHTLNFC